MLECRACFKFLQTFAAIVSFPSDESIKRKHNAKFLALFAVSSSVLRDDDSVIIWNEFANSEARQSISSRFQCGCGSN